MAKHELQLLGILKSVHDVDTGLAALPAAEQRRRLLDTRELLIASIAHHNSAPLLNIWTNSNVATRVIVGGMAVYLIPMTIMFPPLIAITGPAALVAGGVLTKQHLRKRVADAVVDWLKHDASSEGNARLADSAYSNPDLFNALNDAGELFVKLKSRHLQGRTNNFKRDVTSITDANALAESIISFCRLLTVAQVAGGALSVLLQADDIKILIGNVVRLMLESDETTANARETQFSPIIQGGCVGWVKFEFVSNMSIDQDCCRTRKSFDCTVNQWFFWFPTEAEFRAVVKELSSVPATLQRSKNVERFRKYSPRAKQSLESNENNFSQAAIGNGSQKMIVLVAVFLVTGILIACIWQSRIL